jgi:hypothetical protein
VGSAIRRAAGETRLGADGGFGKEQKKGKQDLFTQKQLNQSTDLKLLEIGDIVVATPEAWDRLSRRWKKRKPVQEVDLFLVDQLHLLNALHGHILEVNKRILCCLLLFVVVSDLLITDCCFSDAVHFVSFGKAYSHRCAVGLTRQRARRGRMDRRLKSTHCKRKTLCWFLK